MACLYHCEKHGPHTGLNCNQCLIDDGLKLRAMREKRNKRARERRAKKS